MPNDNNLPIETAGQNAEIGTDIFLTDGVTAHAQIVKVAWGNAETVTRATAGTPLPVRVYGITGDISTITITGSVRGLGNFGITNTESTPIYVTGGVAAYVYGITGAPAVRVTGGVNILSSIGVTGIVTVTGGRILDQTKDSVLVGGTVARNWNLTAVDVIRVLNAEGGPTFATRIVGASGSDFVPIGACGDALKVAIVNTGFSASITFGAVVSVQNSVGTALRVQGTANGTPINVQFQTIPDVNIANTDGVFLVNTPPSSEYPVGNYSVQNQRLYYGFDRNSPEWVAMNNLERLLLGAKPTTNVYHTVGQWLGYIWELETNIYSRLNNIYSFLGSSGGVQARTSVQDQSAASNPIVVRNKTTNLRFGSLMSTFSSGIMYINNSPTDSPYSILLINSSALFNMLSPTPTALFSFDASNPANIFFNYLGDNVINGSTQHTDGNGFIRKPYYLGYRLAPGDKVILPFKFDHAILVTTDPDNEISLSRTTALELDLTIIY